MDWTRHAPTTIQIVPKEEKQYDYGFLTYLFLLLLHLLFLFVSFSYHICIIFLSYFPNKQRLINSSNTHNHVSYIINSIEYFCILFFWVTMQSVTSIIILRYLCRIFLTNCVIVYTLVINVLLLFLINFIKV